MVTCAWLDWFSQVTTLFQQALKPHLRINVYDTSPPLPLFSPKFLPHATFNSGEFLIHWSVVDLPGSFETLVQSAISASCIHNNSLARNLCEFSTAWRKFILHSFTPADSIYKNNNFFTISRYRSCFSRHLFLFI